MSEIATAYVQIEPTFKGVQSKIQKEMGGEGEEGGKSFGAGFAKVLKGTGAVTLEAAKITAAAVGAGATAVTGLVKSATSSFAEYEQLVGGVETLFGDAAGAVQENASKAFATAGMSANEYMETVTSFSASLLQSLDGDTAKAAAAADMAVQDMSDNANKMGTDITAIQNAYQGFAKQNYTMLDNLKLGYGGTKTEMERLLADASKISGIEYNIDSLDDVYNAIHVVQTEMGITGTTAKEASQTIQGSLSALSASWKNVLTGMGDENADLGALIDTLVQNAGTFIDNLIPVVEQALTSISNMLVQLTPVIAEQLPNLLNSLLPMLLTSGAQIISTLAQGLITALPTLAPTLIQVVMSIGQMFIEMLPQLLEVGVQVLVQLALGIAQALPTLIPTIVEVVINMALYLLENIDLLIDAALQLMIGLGEGLINAIPVLIEKAPIIIMKLVEALIKGNIKLIQVGLEMVQKISTAIQTYWPQLLAKVPQLIENLKAAFVRLVNKFVDIGKNIVDGIKQGISNAWDSFVSWMGQKMSAFVDDIKSFFGIASPSKLMAEDVGRWIPAGIAAGIEQGMGVLDKAVQSMGTDVIDQVSISGSMSMEPGADTTVGALYALLEEYLPVIARGDNVNITLEGDMGRLFKAMQRESIRNTQLVGTNAVLSSV